MTRWLERGAEVDAPLGETIAEGLAVKMEPGAITFPLLREYLDGMVLVSEGEIAAATHWAHDKARMLFEPSGAATIAAMRKIDLRQFQNVVGVITGGNIAPARFKNIIAGQL